MNEREKKPEKKISELLEQEKEIIESEKQYIDKLNQELNTINPVARETKKDRKKPPGKSALESIGQSDTAKITGVVTGLLLFLGLLIYGISDTIEKSKLKESQKIRTAAEMPVMTLDQIIETYSIEKSKWYDDGAYTDAKIKEVFINENVIKIQYKTLTIYAHVSPETAKLISISGDNIKLLELKEIHNKMNKK